MQLLSAIPNILITYKWLWIIIAIVILQLFGILIAINVIIKNKKRIAEDALNTEIDEDGAPVAEAQKIVVTEEEQESITAEEEQLPTEESVEESAIIEEQPEEEVVVEPQPEEEQAAEEQLEEEQAAEELPEEEAVAEPQPEEEQTEEEQAEELPEEEQVAEELPEEDAREVAETPDFNYSTATIFVEAGKFNIISKYRRSFISRLIQSGETEKRYYEAIKNSLLSHKKVHSRISWGAESFRYGRKLLVKIAIRGKTLRLYLALSLDEFDKNIYHQRDMSEFRSYEKAPFMVRVKSDLGLKRALRLIDILMQKNGINKLSSFDQLDYVSAYPYEDDLTLLEKGLIRLIEIIAPQEEVALDTEEDVPNIVILDEDTAIIEDDGDEDEEYEEEFDKEDLEELEEELNEGIEKELEEETEEEEQEEQELESGEVEEEITEADEIITPEVIEEAVIEESEETELVSEEAVIDESIVEEIEEAVIEAAEPIIEEAIIEEAEELIEEPIAEEIVIEEAVEEAEPIIEEVEEEAEATIKEAKATIEEPIVKEIEPESEKAEEPIEETEPIIEESVEPIEEPIIKEAVEEAELIIEEAVKETEPIIEEAVKETEPIIEEAIIEEAELIIEEAVIEAETIAEEVEEAEPIIEEAEAIIEDVEEPIIKAEPITEAELIAEEVVIEETVIEEPIVEEIEDAEPIAEEVVIEEAVEPIEEAEPIFEDAELSPEESIIEEIEEAILEESEVTPEITDFSEYDIDLPIEKSEEHKSVDWADELGLEDIDVQTKVTDETLDMSEYEVEGIDYGVSEEAVSEEESLETDIIDGDIAAVETTPEEASETLDEVSPISSDEYDNLIKEIAEEEKTVKGKKQKPVEVVEDTLSDKINKLLDLDKISHVPEYDDTLSGSVRKLLAYTGKIDDSDKEKPHKERLNKYVYREYEPETPDKEMLNLIRRAFKGEEVIIISEAEKKKAANEAARNKDLAALQAMMEEEEQELSKERKREEAAEEDEYYDIGEGTAENTDNFNAFETKLYNSSNRIKYFYSEIKNELMTYRRISNRMSASGDSFRQGGKLIAKMTLSGSILKLHLALSPDDYSQRTYNHYDMGDVKAYEDAPLALDIETPIDLQNAKFLIQEAMSAHFLLYRNSKNETINYAAMYKLKSK